MIDIASQEDNWKTLIQSLPDKIKQSIEDEQIQQEVRKASIETLGKTMLPNYIEEGLMWLTN